MCRPSGEVVSVEDVRSATRDAALQRSNTTSQRRPAPQAGRRARVGGGDRFALIDGWTQAVASIPVVDRFPTMSLAVLIADKCSGMLRCESSTALEACGPLARGVALEAQHAPGDQ
jgi:hypothetical protein